MVMVDFVMGLWPYPHKVRSLLLWLVDLMADGFDPSLVICLFHLSFLLLSLSFVVVVFSRFQLCSIVSCCLIFVPGFVLVS